MRTVAENSCRPHDDLTEQTLRDGLFVCVSCGSPNDIEQPPYITISEQVADRLRPDAQLLLRAERAEAQVAAVKAALTALRDEWLSEPAGSALLNHQAAVRVMHVLDALDTPADTPTEPDADERVALIDVLVMTPMADHIGTALAPVRRTADALLAAGYRRIQGGEG